MDLIVILVVGAAVWYFFGDKIKVAVTEWLNKDAGK